MSTAILRLSENGDLQRIHDKWLLSSACTSQGATLEVDKLQLTSFRGLFFICGFACLIALLIYFIKMIHQFSQLYSEPEFSSQTSLSGRLQSFLSFANEKEAAIESRSISRQQEWDLTTSMDQNASMNGAMHKADMPSNINVAYEGPS